MRNFHTVVLERMTHHSEDFATEPYECAWASEATFFIRIHAITENGATLNSVVQLSVDGIDWVDDGIRFEPISKAGTYFLRVKHFGGWLRLRNEIAGREPDIRLTIHLVLKE